MSDVKPGSYSHYTWSQPESRYRLWFPTLDDYTSSGPAPWAEVSGTPGTENGSLIITRGGKRALVMAPGTWHHVEIIEEDR